jgi:hypothetical protein
MLKTITTLGAVLFGLMLPLIYVWTMNPDPFKCIKSKPMRFICLLLWLPVSCMVRYFICFGVPNLLLR